MQDSRRPAALHAALQFVITTDVLSDHKAILIELLLQALRDDEAAELRRQDVSQTCREWHEHELVLLKSFLKDRIARNWQDADESVMHLAMQLHRDPRSVRDKAKEVGLGASVDYWLSKALKQGRSE
jgi:hypothetical protein